MLHPSAGCPAAVLETLAMAADRLKAAQDPWWVIGGVAIGLHGAPDADIPDVDVVLSVNDARQVLAGLGIPPGQDGGTDRFRSEVFGRWTSPPLAVDFMGGFRVRAQDGWRPVAPLTREAVSVAGRTVHVPSRRELIGICRLFGRPKDLARAEALERLEPQGLSGT